MRVHLQIAAAAQVQIHDRMAREEGQHVIQEWDSSPDACLTAAIDVQLQRDRRFLRLPAEFGASSWTRHPEGVSKHNERCYGKPRRSAQEANSMPRPSCPADKKFFAPFGAVPHPAFMGKRREARERAVQFLFQYDLNPGQDLQAALDHFWESQRMNALIEEKRPTWGQRVELPPPSAEDTAVRVFAEPLIRGSIENQTQIDELIRRHARNWELHRIAVVDRNIMRLAIYEMLFREDIPPVVSINEAVDIAKKFSTHDSGKFVNGILDKIRAEILRPARTAKDAPAT
jgi:N utilization substance protein B